MADKKRRERMRLKVAKGKAKIASLFPNISRRSQKANVLPKKGQPKALAQDPYIQELHDIAESVPALWRPWCKLLITLHEDLHSLYKTPKTLLQNKVFQAFQAGNRSPPPLRRPRNQRQPPNNVISRRRKPRIALSPGSETVRRKKACVKGTNTLKTPKTLLQNKVSQALQGRDLSPTPVRRPWYQFFRRNVKPRNNVTARHSGSNNVKPRNNVTPSLSGLPNVKPRNNVTPSLSGSSGISEKASKAGLPNSIFSSKSSSSESVHDSPGCSFQSPNNNRGLLYPKKLSSQNATPLRTDDKGNNRKRTWSGDDCIPSLESIASKRSKTEESGNKEA